MRLPALTPLSHKACEKFLWYSSRTKTTWPHIWISALPNLACYFPNVVMGGPLQKTLDVVLDPKDEGTRVVEFTDRLALLGILRDNRWARDMVWPYFRDNWDALYKKYGSG
jgi:hypothetical protein